MTWTYSGNPGASPRDRVRFLIGDRAQTPQSITDEELQYLLDETATPEDAAILAAEQMADSFAGLSVTSKRVGDLSLSMDYGRTGARFAATAKRLRSRYFSLGTPLMADTSEKTFSVGMTDYSDSTDARRIPWGIVSHGG
ncbi:hypothetical protein SEA_SHROOMS_27 [Arthrobacter phage Shrooms]|nr:hypothetical protein SEA_SHROOMS_27 [Arthrobacter phage Shrooms]